MLSSPTVVPTETKNKLDYATEECWDQRYTGDSVSFDWYLTHEELEPFLTRHCSHQDDVLMVGCGNSKLSEEMCRAGYERIVNVDISVPVIEKMREQCKDLGMEWHVMDATSMKFEACSFDLAVDKGTLDALKSVQDDRASALVADVWRTLRPEGIFVVISHSRHRGVLLDAALEVHGPSASWELVEARWTLLSDQATLINFLKAKLCDGQNLIDAFKNPVLLRETADEVRYVKKCLLRMDMFRGWRLKKERDLLKAPGDHPDTIAPITTPSAAPPEEPKRLWEAEGVDDTNRNVRKQPFCYVYVLKKRILSGAVAQSQPS